MTIKDKQELVRLLHMHMDDLTKVNNHNVDLDERYHPETVYGVKAQYEHARILAGKLAKEVNDEMSSYWQL